MYRLTGVEAQHHAAELPGPVQAESRGEPVRDRDVAMFGYPDPLVGREPSPQYPVADVPPEEAVGLGGGRRLRDVAGFGEAVGVGVGPVRDAGRRVPVAAPEDERVGSPRVRGEQVRGTADVVTVAVRLPYRPLHGEGGGEQEHG